MIEKLMDLPIVDRTLARFENLTQRAIVRDNGRWHTDTLANLDADITRRPYVPSRKHSPSSIPDR